LSVQDIADLIPTLRSSEYSQYAAGSPVFPGEWRWRRVGASLYFPAQDVKTADPNAPGRSFGARNKQDQALQWVVEDGPGGPRWVECTFMGGKLTVVIPGCNTCSLYRERGAPPPPTLRHLLSLDCLIAQQIITKQTLDKLQSAFGVARRRSRTLGTAQGVPSATPNID